MGMDKNTVIGFVLIGALLIAMFIINSRSNQAYLTEKKRVEDSIALAKPKADPIAAKKDSILTDSILAAKQKLPPVFIIDSAKEARLDTLENDLLKITFTNKGGQPKKVELKNFKKFDGTQIVLENGNFNKLSYAIKTANDQIIQTADIPFVSSKKTVNADKSQSISFVLKDSTGKEIVHQYTIRPGSYLVDFNISVTGADKLVNQNTINLLWQIETEQVEKDIKYERQQSQIAYLENGKYDFSHLGTGDDTKLDKSTEWIAVKQQFFISALSAKNKFQSALVKWVVPADSLHIIAQTTANLNIALAGNTTTVPLQLYYGPSDYTILSASNNKIPRSSDFFATVFNNSFCIKLPLVCCKKNCALL